MEVGNELRGDRAGHAGGQQEAIRAIRTHPSLAQRNPPAASGRIR